MVGTETVKAVAGGLKSQPLAFALVLVNVMFLIGAGWVLNDVATNARERDKMMAQIIADCNEARKQDRRQQ